MQRLCAGAPRGLDDALDVQVALGGRSGPDQKRLIRPANVERRPVGLGEDTDAPDPELAQRPKDPHGDLAAVRDEHLGERSSPRQTCGRILSSEWALQTS